MVFTWKSDPPTKATLEVEFSFDSATGLWTARCRMLGVTVTAPSEPEVHGQLEKAILATRKPN
jgi:hypothetical protein